MAKLLDALSYVREFEHDFHLSIANDKTSAWTNARREKQILEEATGLNVNHHFSALGADWMLKKSAQPEHTRETKRIQECVRRLERARHLPIKPEKLSAIVSIGCLLLIDYVNLPNYRPYKQLSSPVKSCFGVVSGASEVVFHVLTSTTFDPIVRWLLSGLRLWFLTLSHEPDEEWLNRVAKGRERVKAGWV